MTLTGELFERDRRAKARRPPRAVLPCLVCGGAKEKMFEDRTIRAVWRCPRCVGTVRWRPPFYRLRDLFRFRRYYGDDGHDGPSPGWDDVVRAWEDDR